MNYNTFEKLITDLEIISERNSKLYDLGVDLINYDELNQKIISILIQDIFGVEGKDWIDWYLYERPSFSGKNSCKAWDENGKEICYDIPSLWDVVKEFLK